MAEARVITGHEGLPFLLTLQPYSRRIVDLPQSLVTVRKMASVRSCILEIGEGGMSAAVAGSYADGA
jgi:hypothetical protein